MERPSFVHVKAMAVAHTAGDGATGPGGVSMGTRAGGVCLAAHSLCNRAPPPAGWSLTTPGEEEGMILGRLHMAPDAVRRPPPRGRGDVALDAGSRSGAMNTSMWPHGSRRHLHMRGGAAAVRECLRPGCGRPAAEVRCLVSEPSRARARRWRSWPRRDRASAALSPAAGT